MKRLQKKRWIEQYGEYPISVKKSQGVILEQNVGSATPIQIKSSPVKRGSKPKKNVREG